MDLLPLANQTLFVRTCFADPIAWESVCQEINRPPAEQVEAYKAFAALNAAIGQPFEDEEPRANVAVVDSSAFAGLTAEQLIERLPANHHQVLLLVADDETMSHPEHPILVVDLFDSEGESFRAIHRRSR